MTRQPKKKRETTGSKKLKWNSDTSRLSVIDKKWNLARFLTEAAQIEDTSLQISDMKVPQDVKKLNDSMRNGLHPKVNKAVGESYSGDTADKQTHEEGKNCPAYGEKCMKCQKFNHFSSAYQSKGNEQKCDQKPPESPRHKRRVKQKMLTPQQSSSAKLEDT